MIMAQVSDCFLKGIVCDYYQYKVIIFTSKSTTTRVNTHLYYTTQLCYMSFLHVGQFFYAFVVVC